MSCKSSFLETEQLSDVILHEENPLASLNHILTYDLSYRSYVIIVGENNLHWPVLRLAIWTQSFINLTRPKN